MSDDTPHFPDALRERYEPLGALGQGAMGAVFRVRDRNVGREAALKLLRLAKRGDLRRRFQQEASMLARLEHPGILRVFDFGEAEGDVYMVTELLEGDSLDRLPPPQDALAWMLPVAEALEVVHEEGLVHRDVKPANIFRTTEGRMVLLDFGLALDPEVTRMTVEGGVVGTMAYMAPEVMGLAEAMAASDWYSWGVSLYWLVERRHPYQYPDLLQAAGGGGLPPMRLDKTPAHSAIERVLRGTIRADPARRLQGVAALQGAIATTAQASGAVIRRGPLASAIPPPQRRFPWAWLGLAAGAVIAAGVVHSQLALEPAPAPVGPTKPAPREGALPLEIFDAMDKELTDAGDLYRRGEEYRRFPSGAPPEGWRPVLSRDPVDWGYLLRKLPALEEACRWVAGGGTSSELSAEAWERLRALEHRYSRLGLPRLLGPLLMDRGDREFVPNQAELAYDPALARLGTARGGVAVALHAYRRLITWRLKLERQLATYHAGGPVPAGLPPELLDFGGAPVRIRLRSLVEVAIPDRDRRLQTAAFLKPQDEELRRTIFWAFRALGEAKDPAIWAMIFVDRMDRNRVLFSTGMSLLPTWLHTSGAPDGLPARVLEAACLRHIAHYRRAYETGWRDLAARRLELVSEELLTREADGPWGRRLRGRGTLERMHSLLEVGEGRPALQVFARHLDLAGTGDGLEFLRRSVDLLGPLWVKWPEDPATRAVMPRLLAWFDALDGYHTEKRFEDFWREAGHLRRRFGG